MIKPWPPYPPEVPGRANGRRPPPPCISCPFNADSRDRRIRALIHGKNFDLTTADGLFDAVGKILKCLGANAVLEP